MKVIVNGAAREMPEGSTVADVIAGVSGAVSGVAVALNDEVVRRSRWTTTPVADSDRIEVLTAVQGG